jgi:hypothetical protein
MQKNKRREKGFILPGALLLIIIVILLAVMRLYFSREYLHQVGRLSDYERAYHSAASGLVIARAMMEEAVKFLNDGNPATFPKIEKAPADIRSIIKGLLEADGRLKPDGANFDLSPELYSYIKKEFSDVGYINISVNMSRAKPIYDENKEVESFTSASPPANTGFSFVRMDRRECNHIISVNAVSKVGDSKCSAGAFVECRNVNVTPGALGKFVLFIKNQGALKINSIEESGAGGGPGVQPVLIGSGASAANEAALSPQELQKLIDSQGWIYLGGEPRWNLNMTCAAGLAEFQDAPLKDEPYCYQIEDGPLSTNPAIQYYAEMSGFNPVLADPDEAGPLDKHPAAADLKFSSVLNLSNCLSHLTPTLVIGRVSRSFALLQGLYNSNNSCRAPLPYLSEQLFSSDDWPADMSLQSVKFIKQHFNGDYKRYAPYMCDIMTEEYNASNLSLVKFGKNELDDNFIIAPDTVSINFPGVLASSKLILDSFPAALYKAATAGRYTLCDDRGKVLFHGDDFAKFYEPKFIGRKAGYSYKTIREFVSRCMEGVSGKLFIGGIVRLTGEVFSHSGPLVVAPGGGGIILADKGAIIEHGILSPDNEPLTIIALGGDIIVRTSSKIEAGLFAPAGRVAFETPAFTVKGPVAAQKLSLSEGKPDSKRSIEYNKIFDQTDYKNYCNNYKMMIREEWHNYVD